MGVVSRKDGVMRLRSVELKNFKRFTDLHIEGVPDSARLVLLIGANGSGKSSVFDGFEFLTRNARRGGYLQVSPYYRKLSNSATKVGVVLSDGQAISRLDDQTPSNPLSRNFYGRSSLRVVPRNTQVRADGDWVSTDTDAPDEFIQPDVRFNADVQLYTSEIDRLLREPVFAGRDVNPREIFEQQVEPLNSALLRVFGDDLAVAIQLAQFQSASANQAPILEFQKGNSRIAYDLLSHGEKQVVILLLNFMVRREHLEDKVIFIDEMDGHMHRSLQYRLLQEVVEHWVPDSSQLWTATHALGFIEYATQSDLACILDFDELDFDQPQVLRPVPKQDTAVFDVAIDRELVTQLAASRPLVLVEGKDDKIYFDNCRFDVAFVKSENRQAAFMKAKTMAVDNFICLVDRDFLTEAERDLLLGRYPFLRMLKVYCVENELYHPDNVTQALGASFDLAIYRQAWVDDLAENRSQAIAHVGQARQTYGYLFDNQTERRKFVTPEASIPIVDALQSSDFDTFYPVLSAKTYGKRAKQLVTVSTVELSKTSYFKTQVAEALEANSP
jgi:AAA ATPase domain